ncbi:hypothetical protein [Kitasatospora azatica]|uniref:hypothetical protein n=1 Tax=Kitasatospora azatica TaxID=58347 RepID=UPI0012FB9525|nr:hypothetical protein [Kitasatospora azatica]
MTIVSYELVGFDSSPSGSPRRPAAPTRTVTRPRDLLRLPSLPQPEGSGAPIDPSPERCRDSAARCRIAMEFLD